MNGADQPSRLVFIGCAAELPQLADFDDGVIDIGPLRLYRGRFEKMAAPFRRVRVTIEIAGVDGEFLSDHG